MSNIGQATGFTTSFSSQKVQGFTTGSHAAGYTLASIEVDMVVTGTLSATHLASLRMELWSDNGSARPGSKEADLTVPASISTGAVAFAAPANTTLTASTTYFVVMYSTGAGRVESQLEVRTTSSQSEDSGAAAGWSIADIGLFASGTDPGSVTTWSTSAAPRKIRVNGAAASANPPGAPTGLGVTPGATQLALEWTAPSGTVTGYDVHYTSSTSVANDATAGSAVATEWVAVSGSVTGTSHTITGLTNTTPYRVRVRASNGAGSGPWAFGTGTPVATAATGSTDASLSALVMTNNFSSRDTIAFTSSFSSTTYAYAADVGDTRRQVRIVPTVNQANATVKVNGTGVTSAMESGAIDLAFGANTITIEVTAQAGNTRNYTITVTRALPTVSVERSSYAFDEDDAAGFVRLFASQGNVMSGTVTWAPGSTHPADLATDVGTLPTTFTATASDTYPETFSISFTDDALNEEDETFTITLQPGTGYRVGSPATATITIGDNDPPAAPGSLSLTPGHTNLAASWQKPAGPVTKYQVRWKTTAAPDSAVTDGSGNPALGWIVGGEITTTSETIMDLTNGTGYDVQVRANDGQTASGNGWSDWTATQAGTPVQGKTYGFSLMNKTADPGVADNVDVTLSEGAPTGGLALTVTQLLGTSLPDDLCTGTLAESADIGSGVPTSVTVLQGETTARLNFRVADNGDDLVRGAECFALQLSTTASGWIAGNAVLKVTIQRSQGKIAFGSSAASTAKHTATVAENVSGGTLSVPVTVDWLPVASTGFAVEVLGAGTATENTDFSIATKTLAFGPQTAKTMNVEVTITDDAAVETDETIELRLVAGSDLYSGQYLRHAQGSLAQITIQSEDALPGAVTGLGVAGSDTTLAVSWTAPSSAGSSAISGYDVHYTSAAADDLTNDAAVGSTVATAWVTAGAVTGTSHTIRPLTNETEYRVRVRATNASGSGPWAFGKGTPKAGPTYGFTRTSETLAPGASAAVDVTLSEGAPTGGLALTVAQLLGTSVPSGVCTGAGVTLAEAADIGANPPTSVTVSQGQTTARFNYPLADNGDDLVGGEECFALQLSTSETGWLAGDAVLKVTITRASGNIAFGSSAASTAKHTATVAENVSGGTLSVPVTVDWLPAASTGFAVEVLGAGTATENTDFSIATKTLAFGPQTAKTMNVEVTITDDAAVESDETIELRLVAGSDALSGQYGRHAQGSLAQITITNEDALPGQVTGLSLRPGDTTLDVGWTAPSSAGSSAITGYDVHYTSSSTVGADAAVQTGGSPSAANGWVDAGHSGTATLSQQITGLTNDRAHRVRVRAVNGSGAGAWVVGTGTPSQAPAVSLAAAPNPVAEGSSVTVTATLSRALGSDVTIPLTLTDGTAEPQDHGTLASITVTGGQTSAEGTITTAQDTDTEDETFTVALGTLPAAVLAGTPNSVEVTITDDDRAAVTLEASPDPVDEGSGVTVTARLSKALRSAVTIPLTIEAGTTEQGDIGSLASITVAAGRRSGTGVLSTVRDEDEEDETFTVALGSALPSSVEEGAPSSVEITIRDDGPLRAELGLSTERPREGATVVLTATLNHPAPAGGVRVRFTADGAGDNPADPGIDYTLDPEGVGARETEWIGIAEGGMRATARLRVVNDTEPEEDEAVAVGLVGSWASAEYVEKELTIPANDGGGGASAVAWIEAAPNPVDEGYDVTVTVRLSRAVEEETAIPLTVRRGTSEEDDHGTLDEVVVAAGGDIASGTIATSEDADSDDETFTVRLGSLPEGVRAGTPSSVVVMIADPDKPDVWLEVEPVAVEEGERVTVTAVLAEALARSVTIPVEVVRITSEQGDHGTLSSIRIVSGRRDGRGRITTSRDADGEDETFAVVLGEKLPSGIGRGHPDSVEVVIVDAGAPADSEVSLSAAPDPVPEGERVTVTATLSEALSRSVTIPVTVEPGTSEQGDHGTLSGIRIASGQTEGTGTVTTSVDEDTEDETFTVKLRDNLPTGVAAGAVPSVEVTIADRGGDAPGRVRSLRVTPGSGTLTLTWTAPSTGTVTAYDAWYRKRSESDWSAAHDDDYADTSVEIAGLDNGTRYDVRVRGTNDHGAGPWATGSGTPTGGGTSGQLRSLTVTASATRDGTYAAATLSPSFRSSVTDYTATAATGTNFVKVRPTSADGRDVLVEGALVKSGAESNPIETSHGTVILISVFQGDGTPNHYVVKMSIPTASGDVAGRSVTAAVDAVLAVVGELDIEDAAGALFGEKSLEEERLEALDRLGNANGRYDVGDLLSWIERCKGGGARCGDGPKTPPPASDVALPGAVGAAVKRPRRRPSGPGRPRRRRLRGLAVLLAAALWSCDGGGGPTAAIAPEPGTLAVEWTTQAGSPTVAGALVEIDGPGVGEVRAPGLELYESGEGSGPRRFVIAGTLGNSPVLEFQVPDMRQAGLYTVRVLEVAGEDHRLLDAEDYRAGIASN